MIPFALVALAPMAMAQQPLAPDRPTVPAAGIAAEAGPGMLWANPANMAYDRDPRLLVGLARSLENGNGEFSAAAGIAGFGLGVHRTVSPTGDGTWTIHTGSSVELPERLALGLHVTWNLLGAGENYMAYGAGVSWRPLPWIGLGAVAQNIGRPDPRGLAPGVSGAGLAIRPFGRALVLGADYRRTFLADTQRDTLRATVRMRPARGLYLRGSFDTDGWITGGIEFYFGRMGFGSWATHGPTDLIVGAWVGTDEPGEALVRSGRRLPAIALPQSPPAYRNGPALLGRGEMSWLDLLEMFENVGRDRGARGLILTVAGSAMSWARCEELANAIEQLEASGVPVTLYINGSGSLQDYVLGAAASRIVIHPAGVLDLHGIRAEISNYGEFLDSLGVEYQYVRRSEFKSAVEQLGEADPSDPTLEQARVLLQDTWDHLVDRVANGRDRPRDEIEAWLGNGPWTPTEAVKAGIIDEIAYPDELEDRLSELGGRSLRVQPLRRPTRGERGWEAPSQIGIVYVDGLITSGRSSGGGLLGVRTSGSRTLVAALDSARSAPEVKAVVLRIDSPGGSAFASDEIWRAIRRLQDAGKPVVVSMGAVAASGGYYIAAPADAIWCEPTTVTGSIGVYAAAPVVASLYDRLGIRSTVLTQGETATLYDAVSPWTDAERTRMNVVVQSTYEQFKRRVASGRDMNSDEVEAVARGRVWSGVRAKEVGLVDHLGGLTEAIEDARQRAGLQKRRIDHVTLNPDGGPLGSLNPLLFTAARQLMGTVAPTGPLDNHRLSRLLVLSSHSDEQVWMVSPIDYRVKAR